MIVNFHKILKLLTLFIKLIIKLGLLILYLFKSKKLKSFIPFISII